MTYVLCFFFPTASATVYGRSPKFFRAEHSAMAEGENYTYGPTLVDSTVNPAHLPQKLAKWEPAFFMHNNSFIATVPRQFFFLDLLTFTLSGL